MKKKQIHIAICILFILLSFVLIRGCSNYTEEEYEEKTVGGLHDKSVNMKYFSKKNHSEILLKFKQKEIPFEMPLFCSEGTWAGRIEVSGKLDEGILTVSISDGVLELWKQQYGPGIIEDVSIPELYDTNYSLLLEFHDTKGGEIHLVFKTTNCLVFFRFIPIKCL